jgi:hypothetical protein
MGGIRTWIFRGLVLIGAVLFIYAWFQPWWTAYIVALSTTAVNIYAYGIESFVPSDFSAWIAGYDQIMPSWFDNFMWIYLAVCVVVILFGMFASSDEKERIGIGKIGVSLPSALVGGVGISFIIVAITAVIVISMNLKGFYNAPLNGVFRLDMGDPYISNVETKLTIGYYLGCAGGLLLIITAALRRFIVGKK